jgi:hypothetical protein
MVETGVGIARNDDKRLKHMGLERLRQRVMVLRNGGDELI